MDPIDQVTVGNSESSSSQSNEMRLLRHSWNDTRKMNKFNILNNPLKTTDPMVNTIGLHGIARKFDSYTNCDEFLADIDELVRSYSIQHGAKPDYKTAIDALSELCHRDVRSIRTCPECFDYWVNDPNDYFTKVCAKPHLIVYAKADGFSRWPAKVMSVNGNMVNVEFFGDHTQADVQANQCFLYAKRQPVRARPSKFNDALVELDAHIKQIEEKFGTFYPAGSKVQLNPNDLESQLMAMIPGAFEERSDDQPSDEDDQSN